VGVEELGIHITAKLHHAKVFTTSAIVARCMFTPRITLSSRHSDSSGRVNLVERGNVNCYYAKCRRLDSLFRWAGRRNRVAHLAFLKSDTEILAFFEHLWLFLEAKKSQILSGFFQSRRLGSGKTLPELHIHYKFLLKRVYNAGCTELCKYFIVALKMIDVIHKKQTFDSVITGKENSSKKWTCIISMFLTSFNVYIMFGYACFMCICLKTAISLFLAFFRTRSGFLW